MGSLIVPVWKSASFWPLICPDGTHLAPFVHKWVYIPFQPTTFIPGKSGNNIGQAMNSDSIILCLWVDFTASPRDYIYGFCTKDFTGACAVCTH